MSYNNYSYQNGAIIQESLVIAGEVYWSDKDIYQEGTIVDYEGLRYIALRLNANEIPLLCQSGAWEQYSTREKVRQPRSIGFGNDKVISYAHEAVDTQFLEHQTKEDIKAALKHFDFKRIKAFNISEDKICTRLFLPSIGNENTHLQWESNAPEYLSNQGAVVRPSNGKDYPVWLKLTVSKGEFYSSKIFELWVSAKGKEIVLNEEESVERAYKELDFLDFKGDNVNISNIKHKLNFFLSGKYGTTLAWLSMQKDFLHDDGTINTSALKEDKVIKIHVVIRKGKAQKHKRFYLKLEKNLAII